MFSISKVDLFAPMNEMKLFNIKTKCSLRTEFVIDNLSTSKGIIILTSVSLSV